MNDFLLMYRECVAGRQISRPDHPEWIDPCPRAGVHPFGVRYSDTHQETYVACDRHWQLLNDAGTFTNEDN